MTESSSGPDLLNELAHDFAERYRRGERPSLTEYSARYPELAAEIRELFPALVLIEEFGSVAGPPAGPGGRTALPDGAVPRQLGEYRVLREVARGGMGIVYEAVQESLGRHAALKVLPFHSLASADHLERFRREARAAANLHHSNIVPVFGVGEHEGVHYFAMQFIQGQSLNVVLHELKRLRQVKAVPPTAPTDSPASVHEGQGDRDLSANLAGGLMSGRFPGQAEERRASPEDKIPTAAGPADPAAGERSASTAVVSGDRSELGAQSGTRYFRSVARVGVQVAEALAYAHGQGILHRDVKPANLLLDREGTVWIIDFGLAKAEGVDDLTSPGDLVGTLRYMAPERFQGQADPRSDVFSLGLTLYEMATLQPAFAGSERAQLIERLLHDEPPRPRAVNPQVPRDLETIILKASAREPEQRYQSAAELAEDLRCFLADRTIQGRRSTARERTWRWCRRNPVVATLLGLTAALVGTVAVVASLAAWRLNEGLHLTQEAEAKATGQLYHALVDQARASRLSHRPGQRSQSLKALTQATAIARARNAPEEDFLELRNETIACLARLDVRVAREWDGYPAGSTWVDFDGALERYARVDRSGAVSIRRVADDAEIYPLPGMGPGEARCHFRTDGQFLALWKARGDQGEFLGRLQVWKLTGPEPCLVLEEPSGVCDAVAFLPDSQELVIGHTDGSLSRCDLASGKRAERVRLSLEPLMLAVHPSEKKLALACRTHVQIFDLQAARVVAEFRYPEVSHPWIAWHPDGKSVAAVGGDNAIYLWDVATGKETARLREDKRNNHFFTFNHAGDVLVSANLDDFLGVWNPRTGQQRFSTEANVQSLRFSPDDRLLAGGIDGPKLRVWEITPACGYHTLVRDPVLGKGAYRACATSPRDRLLAVGMTDGVGLWDLTSGRPLPFLPTGFTRYPLFDASGALLTNSPGGLLRFAIQADPEAPGSLRIGAVQKLPLPGTAFQMAGSRDGRVLASAQGWGGLVWRQGVAGSPLRLPHADARYIAVSPDGRWVATGSYDDGLKVKVWEATSGDVVTELSVEGGTRVVFSPDGRWLGTGGAITGLWEVGSWRQRQRFTAASRTPVAFSADSSMFAFEAGHGTVRLIDPDSGRELARLEDPNQDRADDLTFNADGTQLLTNGEAVSIHVWDLRVIREQLAARGLDWAPASAAAGKPKAVPPLQVTVAAGVLVPCPYPSPRDWGKAIAAYAAELRSSPGSGDAARNNLAWLLATCPDPHFRDPARAVDLATKAVQLESKDGLFRTTLGVAQYRAGDWKAALASLRRAMDLRQGGDGIGWFFLAMAHWRVGEKQEARHWYGQAVQWMEKNEPALAQDAAYGEQLQSFREEAEALVKEKRADQRK
jgi:serine/threonine protein kinase/WD40 repeat protein